MDQSIVTLIISLAGIASTLISSSLGLYFIARARNAPLRELLFTKQVELIAKILQKQELIRALATILMNKDYPHKDEVCKDLAKHIRDFCELEAEGMAILPADLWAEMRRLSRDMDDLLVEFDKQNIITQSTFKSFLARAGKVGLLSRAIIGADELTEESIKLFSSMKQYDNLTSIEVSSLKAIINKKK